MKRTQGFLKGKRWSLPLLILTGVLWVGVAHASNGLRSISSGPVSIGMGGTGTAMPLNSDAAYINPAGMVDLRSMINFHFTMAFPNNFMGSSLAPAGNPDAVRAEGTDDASFFPSASFVLKMKPDSKFVLGGGAVGRAGFQVEFPVSRFNSSITNNLYDRSGRYQLLTAPVALAIQATPKLNVGFSVDINYAFFSTDSATLAPGFPETEGRNKLASALGVGGRIGMIYKVSDKFQLGGMYVFRSRFRRFDRYADLIPDGLDMPQEVNFGLAGKPLPGMTLMFDYRWLNWAGSGFIGQKLAQDALEWRDQHVFAFGINYDFGPSYHFPVSLRAGYNYGRSPITSKTAFRNLVIPTVIEHHMTFGLSVEATKNVGLDFAYVYEFENTVTDDGSGNPTGTGAFTGTSAQAVIIGIRGAWGPPPGAPPPGPPPGEGPEEKQ